MKKTKDVKKEESKLDEILNIESMEDAEKFEESASGRMFCKKGERIQDICNDEFENYICRTDKNLLLKWYLHRKKKKCRNKLLLESRITSITRALAIEFLNTEEEIDNKELTLKVKNYILEKVKEYKKLSNKK